MCEQQCRSNCCKIHFCPLVVAFGRTIHTFQGQKAGPGKAIPSIIVNPGNRKFETLNPGTLNCCITRASTIGIDDITKSAIYFTGPHINVERFQNMTSIKSGQFSQNVQFRNIWTRHLEERVKITKRNRALFTKYNVDQTQDYFNSVLLSVKDFDSILQYYITQLNII